MAGVGCFSEDIQWDRPTYPLWLFDFCDPTQRISQWTGGAERHAHVFHCHCELMAVTVQLSGSMAVSTQAMLTPGRGQEMLGVAAALQHPSLTTACIRDYIQLRGGCFPTNIVLTTGYTSLICPCCAQCASRRRIQLFSSCRAASEVTLRAPSIMIDKSSNVAKNNRSEPELRLRHALRLADAKFRTRMQRVVLDVIT